MNRKEEGELLYDMLRMAAAASEIALQLATTDEDVRAQAKILQKHFLNALNEMEDKRIFGNEH